MKKKFIFVLILSFIFVFALAFCCSATSVYYNTSDSAMSDMVIEGSDPSNAGLNVDSLGGYISYGNVPDGNFVISIFNVSGFGNVYENTIYWVDNVEAFKTRYNGYSFTQFINELNSNGHEGVAWYFKSENAFNFFLNYSPVSEESISNQIYSEINSEMQSFASENNFIFEPITITGKQSFDMFLYDNIDYGISLQRESIKYYSDLADEREQLLNELDSKLKENYQNGYADGIAEGEGFENGIFAIFSAPVYIMSNVFNFEIFGINLFSLITAIITIMILAFIVKKLAS